MIQLCQSRKCPPSWKRKVQQKNEHKGCKGNCQTDLEKLGI